MIDLTDIRSDSQKKFSKIQITLSFKPLEVLIMYVLGENTYDIIFGEEIVNCCNAGVRRYLFETLK